MYQTVVELKCSHSSIIIVLICCTIYHSFAVARVGTESKSYESYGGWQEVQVSVFYLLSHQNYYYPKRCVLALHLAHLFEG